MNADCENAVKNCLTCLDFQQMQPKEMINHHQMPGNPWDIIGGYMFSQYNKHYLCIVDYHSKCPISRRQKAFQQTASF